MEVKWTEKQRDAMNQKLTENLKKRAGMDNYREILQQCKKHEGPVLTASELKALVKRCGDDEKRLKSFLRQEVGFKKVMHPVYAQERPDLYKMNFLTREELLENLMILMDTSLDEEEVLFLTEEEIIDQILAVPSTVSIVPSECEVDNFATDGTVSFTDRQPLAVMWDEGDHRYWVGALFLRNNDDGTFEVDNLVEKKNPNRQEWIRPEGDDIQDVLAQFIIPCEVRGEWDYSKRTSTFVVENVVEIEKHFKYFDV